MAYGKEVIRTGIPGAFPFHDGPLPYFEASNLTALGIRNCYTTKLGGVSLGFLSELNLSPSKEALENVQENVRRVCETLHMNAKNAVLSHQTHTVNIRTVTEKDLGKGFFRPRDYENVDGLMTDLPDVPLVTLHADCVPLYLCDPVRKAVALSHAGWRGTVSDMAGTTVRKMAEVYGSDPKDLIAAIGPSICRDHYEVGQEVADAFLERFGDDARYVLFEGKRPGKYQLDLQEANRRLMIRAGIREQSIEVAGVCTKCNSGLLFSHRVTGDRRGLNAAFLSL